MISALPTLVSSLFAASPALAADSDLDALDDADEVLWGTDVLDPDTDGDTIPDGAEIYQFGTDPLVSDALCTSWIEQTLPINAVSFFAPQLGDLDGDGDLDLVVLAEGANGLGWSENRGRTFGPRREIVVLDTDDLALTVFDADGDGDDDIVTSEAVYPNLGGASFGPPVALGPLPSGGLVAADLDGDGDLDLIGYGYAELVWAPNLGGNAFDTPISLDAGDEILAAIAADLDLDGDIDLAAVRNYKGTFLWGNLGGGSFAAPIQLSNEVDDVAFTDVDDDGLPDLLAARGRGSTPTATACSMWRWPRSTKRRATTRGSRATTRSGSRRDRTTPSDGRRRSSRPATRWPQPTSTETGTKTW